jgi:ATP-binding cassette subfamily B protein
MASKPPLPDKKISASADDPAAPEPDKKLAANPDVAHRTVGDKPAISSPPDDQDEDVLEVDDDEDDEDLVVFTAKEAAGALATIYAFVKPYLKNYKKMLTFVSLGVVVETLFNVFMPLSLKFLIDDALGEEDFQALYVILGVLAVAGIFTSIVAVWYERWDARLAASIIADVRANLFGHVQDLPAAYFARTRRGEILSRFSIDLSGLRGIDQEFCQQRSIAVPRVDRGYHPDAVPELAARRGGAAGVPDHADRPADPDAEGGAGELRSEAQ